MQMLWTGEQRDLYVDFFFLTPLGFPDTIDRLEPEIGQTGGPRPIIFGNSLWDFKSLANA